MLDRNRYSKDLSDDCEKLRKVGRGGKTKLRPRANLLPSHSPQMQQIKTLREQAGATDSKIVAEHYKELLETETIKFQQELRAKDKQITDLMRDCNSYLAVLKRSNQMKSSLCSPRTAHGLVNAVRG